MSRDSMFQLRDIIPPELVKEILLYATVFLSATASLLLIALIVDKMRTERREAKLRNEKRKYVAEIGAYLAGEEAKLEPRTRLQYEALTDVCVDMLLSISGEMARQLRVLINEVGIVDYYKAFSGSNSWLRRYHAIEKLGFLCIDELKDYFVDLLGREQRAEVKAKLIWALSLIADKPILDLVTKALVKERSSSAKFNEYVYTNIIQSFRRNGMIPDFVQFLEDLTVADEEPLLLKRDIVEACGSSVLYESSPVLIEYFSHHNDNPEMQIACMRALGRMGGTGASKLIVDGFTSEDWRVRAVAANAAHLCSEDVIPQLRTLLYDQIYFVRINASKALGRFGMRGLQALEEESDSGDRFVRDAARYILEEKLRHA